MIVMMVGILGIAGALVWRIAQTDGVAVALPDNAPLALPAETTAISVSRAGSRLYLLLEDNDSGERRIEERQATTGDLIRTFALVPISSDQTR